MVIAFTRQLYILIKAGIPLLKALQIISAQLPKGRFKLDIDAIIQEVQEGRSFSESLENARRFFSLFYINLIKAAEVSGNLTGVLRELSQHLIQQRRITKQVQGALMYPILVLSTSLVILSVLIMFVVPVFTKIFADLGGSLPPATLFLINLSRFAGHWGWIVIILVVTLVITISFASHKSVRLRQIINKIAWRLPLFGNILKTMEMARFCRTLGTLLSSGVTLIKGLDVLIDTTEGVLLEDALSQIRGAVEQGENLSVAMEQAGVFPLTLVKMIQVGEESGKIADLFLDAATDYEDEVSFAVTGFLSLLEPILIVIMGAIVGFIVMSLFFPIFTMSSLVR